MIKIILFSMLLISGAGYAQSETKPSDDACASARPVAAKFLHLDNLQSRDDTGAGHLAAEACKPLPNNPSLIFSAFAYDNGGFEQKELAVLLIDTSKQIAVASYQTSIGEDASTIVGPDSLFIDTAKYQVAPGIRAIGLRFSSSGHGPSCASGAESGALTLFVQLKDKLQPVLDINTEREEAIQGCIGTPTDKYIIETTMTKISITHSATNGLYDLLLTDTLTIESGGLESDDLPSQYRYGKKVNSKTLKFDGQVYR